MEFHCKWCLIRYVVIPETAIHDTELLTQLMDNETNNEEEMYKINEWVECSNNYVLYYMLALNTNSPVWDSLLHKMLILSKQNWYVCEITAEKSAVNSYIIYPPVRGKNALISISVHNLGNYEQSICVVQQRKM